MAKFFTAHARVRALERYNLPFSVHDMSVIFTACVNGSAVCVQDAPKTHTYVMDYGGARIFPRLNHDKSLLVTFMPKDFMKAGSRMRNEKRKGAKQKPRTGPSERGAYRRERIRASDCDADW